MTICVCTVNTIGHWLPVPFKNRSRIPLRGLSGFWGTEFRILLRGLSGFRVTPGLLVPEETMNRAFLKDVSHLIKNTELY